MVRSTNISEIKVDNKIASNPMDIAETINDHFTNVAQVLVQDIPVVDANPESYSEPTDPVRFLCKFRVLILFLTFCRKLMKRKPPVLI